jgi:hypothetical protein
VTGTSAGVEVVYGECSRCGARAETLFDAGRSTFWAGQATCEHGPHVLPAPYDQRVRDLVAKAHRQGKPLSLRVKPADALS